VEAARRLGEGKEDNMTKSNRFREDLERHGRIAVERAPELHGRSDREILILHDFSVKAVRPWGKKSGRKWVHPVDFSGGSTNRKLPNKPVAGIHPREKKKIETG
jgi:hypothetical protein